MAIPSIGFDGAAQRFGVISAELRCLIVQPRRVFGRRSAHPPRRSRQSHRLVWPVSRKRSAEHHGLGRAAPRRLFVLPRPDTDDHISGSVNSSANITDATNLTYVLENATAAADNGKQFRCILTKGKPLGHQRVATLTVVNNNPGIVNGYSNAVMAEASLMAYFPVDGSLGHEPW